MKHCTHTVHNKEVKSERYNEKVDELQYVQLDTHTGHHC